MEVFQTHLVGMSLCFNLRQDTHSETKTQILFSINSYQNQATFYFYFYRSIISSFHIRWTQSNFPLMTIAKVVIWEVFCKQFFYSSYLNFNDCKTIFFYIAYMTSALSLWHVVTHAYVIQANREKRRYSYSLLQMKDLR